MIKAGFNCKWCTTMLLCSCKPSSPRARSCLWIVSSIRGLLRFGPPGYDELEFKSWLCRMCTPWWQSRYVDQVLEVGDLATPLSSARNRVSNQIGSLPCSIQWQHSVPLSCQAGSFIVNAVEVLNFGSICNSHGGAPPSP